MYKLGGHTTVRMHFEWTKCKSIDFTSSTTTDQSSTGKIQVVLITCTVLIIMIVPIVKYVFKWMAFYN